MSKLFNKYVIAIISFYIFWLGFLPLLLANTVELLSSNFSHNSDYAIKIENPKIRLYFIPVIKFKADSIYLSDKDSSNFIKTGNVNIKIRILPLLSGKVHINSFKVSNLFLKKELEQNVVLKENFFENLSNAHFSFDSISLDKFKLSFESHNKKPPIIYEGKYFKFDKKNRYLSLNIDSGLTSKNSFSKIYLDLFLLEDNYINDTKFNIDISNLDIKPVGEFFKNFLPENITEIDGLINVNADKNKLKISFENVKILDKNSSYSIILPEKLSVKSDFNVKQNLINLINAEINSANTNIMISGKIKDYLSKSKSAIDLKIIINKSKTEEFIKALPPFKTEEIDGYKLKKYNFLGNAIGNLTIFGHFPEPNITGRLFIKDGILIKPIPNTTNGATIKMNFTGRHVNYDVNVPAGNSQRVWVKGLQELYNIKYSEITIKSTENVSLHSAKEVVDPLHEILNFVTGPVPIIDAYGTGNIDLVVKGTRAYPHAWGGLNFHNASVYFIEIPGLVLNNAEASLNFNDTGATFKTTKGKVNDKDFSITGTCNLNGNFNFDALSQGQPTEELYNAVKTSTSMLEDIKKTLPPVDKIIGQTDLKMKIYGNVKKIEDLKFNKNAFAKGLITLKDNKITAEGITIDKANAEIKVDGITTDSQVDGYIGTSPLKISAKIKNNYGEVSASIPKFDLNCIIENNYTGGEKYLPLVNLTAQYMGDLNNIEYEKLKFDAKIIPQNNGKMFDYNSGQISMNKGNLSIKNLDFFINKSVNNIKADLQVLNMFSSTPITNGFIKIRLTDLKILNEIFGKNILPKKINNILKDYEFENGDINLLAKFNDGKLSTESNLAGIKFNYLPLELPVEILNGKLTIKNNDMNFRAVNILADHMPVFIDGKIKDILDKRTFNLYFNTKPKQDFLDKYINKNAIYPLKIKGDIVGNVILKGYPEDYDLNVKLNMSKDSSIYYYGATIGDIENALNINLNSEILNNKKVRIKEFMYDKIIDSQNGKQTHLNMIKVKGGVNLTDNDLEFDDLCIKTSNPTDAKIFNIIFGKPNIKQGRFTSNLKIRGKLSNPKILGDFHIVETDIPFLDTTMKNIEILFKDRILEITSKGEVFGNDISVEAEIKNKLTKPYYIQKALISARDMDLNRIVNKLKSAEAENAQAQDTMGNFDINAIVAGNLKLKADNLSLRNIHATNFEAETALNEQRIFEMKNFKFNIAQGLLSGKYSYNLKNNDIKLKMNAESISANDITWALFDLQNQIYGDLTGNVELSCNGDSYEKCMQTLNGNTNFNVKNGKMPKLGSLEYLLKAGNLIKGGITSLSINSVIDLISPTKTGEFSDIFGFISIKDGVADDIEITTQGKNLSLFITGTYNFATSIADMEVLGMLSRKISTMFGPIGNVSVNTLFNLIPGIDLSKDSEVIGKINRIPGIEISSKTYRKFLAIIKGNINGDNYVTSFKWIN